MMASLGSNKKPPPTDGWFFIEILTDAPEIISKIRGEKSLLYPYS
jgi:hypothetical protein